MKKLSLCLLAIQLAALPCLADAIPSRAAEETGSARETVQHRLETLGVSSARAEDQVDRLTQDELAYFAADTNRIQAAGRLYWYEWVGGLLFLGILTFIGLSLSN